ncbi:MAG: trypsin-like peptidase domain-containing protein [Planctomycetota bacterium]
MRIVLLIVFGFAMFAAGPSAAQDAAHAEKPDVRDSVVKIYATYRGPDFESPWTKLPPEEYTGSGFVIAGDLILTNAHVVEQSSQIFVQPPRSADRLRAELVSIARGIDLAIIRLRRDSDRESFHADHPPLTLKSELPPIGGSVQAYGYPLGGEQLSITEGIVSRIEFADYYFETFGLRVQVDAALNPGNSGGPVVMGGEVIGVTFSGIDQAENIGYVIPAEEVRAFLEDVADGAYDGRKRLFAGGYQTAENDAVRDWLGLDRSQTGVIYTGIPDGEGFEDLELPLERWDVLDRIGDVDIDNDGLVTVGDGVRLNFAYLIPQLENDGSVPFTVIRSGRTIEVDLPVSESRDLLMSYIGNGYPEYFVLGPMVFSPVTRDHLAEFYTAYLALTGSPIALRAEHVRRFEDEELVVIARDFLPHPITKGYEVAYRPAVRTVNGTAIRHLTHMIELIRDSEEDFLVFEFWGRGQETLVFDRLELIEATEEILEDNSIRRQGSSRFEEALRG